MKKLLLAITFVMTFASFSQAQSTLIGAETFSVNLPQGFDRTIGISDYGTVQWANVEKEIYGYVIIENVDEYKLAELDSNLKSLAELSLTDFNELPKYKLVNTKTLKTDGGKDAMQNTITYFDEASESTIMMQITMYKTSNFIYKVISYSDSKVFKQNEKDIEYISKKIILP